MRVLSVRSKRLFLSVSVIVYCLKIIGLAPFSVPIGKPAQINPCNSRVQAFYFSKFGRTYNILLLIPVIAVPVLFPPNFPLSSETDSVGFYMVKILYAIWTAKNILFIFTSCIIVICWAFKQNNAASILNRLLEVDVRLAGLKEQPFNKRALISLAVHVLLNACMWIIHCVMIVMYFDIHKSLDIVRNIPEYIIYWFIIEYLTIVGLVSRDLETVNTYLLDFEEFGSHLSRPPVRNDCVLPVVNVPTHSDRQIASLKQLRSVRTTLFELCEDIADFFSLPILFCIASSFIPCIQMLYHATQLTDYFPSGLTACWTVIFVLQFMYPIVSLTLNVARTMKEAELTGRIVHKLLAVARTEEIRAELEQFSLQLLHEKVNFTAYGLFTLDSTLLQSIDKRQFKTAELVCDNVLEEYTFEFLAVFFDFQIHTFDLQSLLRLDTKAKVSLITKITKLQILGGVASYAIILTQFRSSVCDGNGNGRNTSSAE